LSTKESKAKEFGIVSLAINVIEQKIAEREKIFDKWELDWENSDYPFSKIGGMHQLESMRKEHLDYRN
jgi:hypothetical protein